VNDRRYYSEMIQYGRNHDCAEQQD